VDNLKYYTGGNIPGYQLQERREGRRMIGRKGGVIKVGSMVGTGEERGRGENLGGKDGEKKEEKRQDRGGKEMEGDGKEGE